MIIGIGSDTVEHDLNEKMIIWGIDDNLAKRVLSELEFEVHTLQPNNNYLAGRFAAKEAILKCLGTGMQDGISLKDIEISKLASGQPFVKLSGSIKQIAENMGINNWHISITHSPTFSLAFAIAEQV